MLPEPTIEKLKEMHLSKMADTLRKIRDEDEYRELSFDEKIGLIVDSEWVNRQNNRLIRLTRAAKFSIPEACVENIRFDAERHLDKGLITKLSLCTYIQKSQNVIIMGATGTGKTYLSCALGHSAISNFYSVKYIRLPDLLAEFEEALIEKKYQKMVETYSKYSLLIIDEWLTFPIKLDDARNILQIIEKRLNKKSTIFCTQFDIPGWYEKIGDPTSADAICDRVINYAHRIRIDGESMRKIIGMEQRDEEIHE